MGKVTTTDPPQLPGQKLDCRTTGPVRSEVAAVTSSYRRRGTGNRSGWQAVERRSQEVVAACGDVGGVEWATVVGEPGPALQLGWSVQGGDGIPVGNGCRLSIGMALLSVEDVGRCVWAVLECHLQT